MKFVPLQDLGDDAEAIVARLREAAGVQDEETDREAVLTKKVTELRDLVEDLEAVKRANDNLKLAGEDVSIWKRATRRHRGEGSPH